MGKQQKYVFFICSPFYDFLLCFFFIELSKSIRFKVFGLNYCEVN